MERFTLGIFREGYNAYSEETEKMFKFGLKVLSLNFSPIEGEIKDLRIMVFTQQDGLQSFCNNNDSLIDSTWFSVVEKYVDAFSKQYNLGKIIFSVAPQKYNAP